MLTLTDKIAPSPLHKLPGRRKVVCSFGMWLECGWYQQWGNYSRAAITASPAIVQYVHSLSPFQLFKTTTTKHKNYQCHHKKKSTLSCAQRAKWSIPQGIHTFLFGQVPQRLLWADSWTAHVKITIRGILDGLKECAIF